MHMHTIRCNDMNEYSRFRSNSIACWTEWYAAIGGSRFRCFVDFFFSLLQLQLPSDVNEDPTSQDSIVNLFYFSIMIIE